MLDESADPHRFAATVIVTARDEPATRINAMLDAVGAQEVEGQLEVVVAAPAQEIPGWQLTPRGAIGAVVVVDNPSGQRSAGLNLAVRAARSDLICRIDARSRPPRDYVRRCLARLASDPWVGIVGGAQLPEPGGPGPVARGVARALANPWFLGAPAYRLLTGGGPVDTVYLGCFRRSELLRLGGFDEELLANEDFDVAQRYRRAGMSIWLEPGLGVPYEARTTIGGAYRQYEAFGRSKVRYWWLRSERPNARQLLAMTGTVVLFSIALGAARRPGRLGRVMGAGYASLLVVDGMGGVGEPGLRVRLISATTGAVVVGAWVIGVFREAVGA